MMDSHAVTDLHNWYTIMVHINFSSYVFWLHKIMARISCLVAAVHVATKVCVILGRIWDADGISDQGKDQVRLAARAKQIDFNFEQSTTLQEIPPRYRHYPHVSG